jgi:predicted anti-sigma-YlaC factor YlaD
VSIHNHSESHLEEDDILQAVVDETDLSVLQQQHLAQCLQCRTHKEQLEQELAHLGQLAERYAPRPQKRIIVADQKVHLPLLNWRIVFSAAAVAAVILIVWGTSLIQNQRTGSIGNSAQDMVEAEKLMTQVNVLVENALPPIYLDIVGETGSNLDEDFMHFLIPGDDGADRISTSTMKGSILC